MEIRTPREDEYAQIVRVINSEKELWKQAFSEKEMSELGIGIETVTDLSRGAKNRNYLVAVKNEQIVGFASWYKKNARVGWLSMLQVNSVYYHNGIGTHLLHKVEGEVQQEGCRALALETQKKAEWALKFYIKNGYRILSLHDTEGSSFKGTVSRPLMNDAPYVILGKVFDDEKFILRKTNDTQLEKLCEHHCLLIQEKMPGVTIEHIGATSVPGLSSKGDLDIQVRVNREDFEGGKRLLNQLYDVAQLENWSDNFASFQDDSGLIHVGIQLTVKGTAEDSHFYMVRDMLLCQPEWVAKFNHLKQEYNGKSMAEYRRAKFTLIEHFLATQKEVSSHSAGGVIIQSFNGVNKVLLVEHMDNTWVFPKGHCEPGETTQEAAMREVREEVGYESKIVRPLGVVRRASRDEFGTLKDQRVITMFLMRISKESSLATSEEVCRWFTYDEALIHLRYDADKEFLKQHKELFD